MREREGGTLSTYSTISQPYSLASLPPKQRNLMNDKVADKANKKMGMVDAMQQQQSACRPRHAMPGGNSWYRRSKLGKDVDWFGDYL